MTDSQLARWVMDFSEQVLIPLKFIRKLLKQFIGKEAVNYIMQKSSIPDQIWENFSFLYAFILYTLTNMEVINLFCQCHGAKWYLLVLSPFPWIKNKVEIIFMFVNFLKQISCSLTLSIFLLGGSYYSFWFAKTLYLWGKLFKCVCVGIWICVYVCFFSYLMRW